MHTGGGDGNRNEPEGGGHHKAALKHKKPKPKTLKWKSSNKDMMSSKAAEAGRSSDDGVYDDDDAVLCCSLTTASINSLMIPSRKRVRTLGKVAQQCDSIDPPVPRRLRSAINKRVRHVKKRRNLSAISAQISFADQQTRFVKQQETSTTQVLLTEEEEVADALLSLSQAPSASEEVTKADRDFLADRTNRDGVSTDCSAGGAKEGERITAPPPSSAAQLPDQAACVPRRTENVPHHVDTEVNGGDGNRSNNNINQQPLPEQKAQVNDLSSGVAANLPSPCKSSSNNSERMPLKVQLDDGGKNYPPQKPEAWLVDSNESANSTHEYGKAKTDDGAQETIRRVQTPPPPCTTPDGYLIKPSSSKLAVQEKTVSEFSKVTASANLDKAPLVNNGAAAPKKAWKRSVTHVYVSHLIQTHLNMEKAPSSQQCQVKPEERSHVHHTSQSAANGSSSVYKSSKAHGETCYSVHVGVRLPVQPSNTGICTTTMSAAAAGGGRQKMVSGGGGNGTFLNLPASSAAQHVPYLHPQIAPRGAASMPYPFPHLPPHSRANLAPPAAALQQMQQYMCSNPGYPPRPGLLAATASSSSATMKLQQLGIPSHHHHQQQMWQFHIAHQYQAARPDAAPPVPGGAWHNMAASSSLRPTTTTMPVLPSPPAMELLCAPYQGGGGGRQPQQLRLM